MCRRAHVTNATLLAGCEIDYGATGDHNFPTSTGATQHGAGIPGTIKPSGLTVSRVPWTRLSSQVDQLGVTPTIATTGGQAVVAYRRSTDQAIEAATFTAGNTGVGGLSRRLAFTNWQSTADPVLLSKHGGGLQVILPGEHSSNGSDPLNGVVIAPRNPSGSFGTPSQLNPTITSDVVSATLAADGSTPLWTYGTLIQMEVFSGSTAHDLTSRSPGSPGWPTLGRDSSGRVWLAWYVGVGSSAGLYMMRLDSETGAAIGPALRVPGSDDGPAFSDPVTMACAKECRLLFINPVSGGEQIVSWGPGESEATAVSPGILNDHPQAPQSIVAAYTSDGRLWVAYYDAESRRYFAKLGDVLGKNGQLVELQKVGGFDDTGAAAAATIGNRLVLTSDWRNGTNNHFAVWATVINP